VRYEEYSGAWREGNCKGAFTFPLPLWQKMPRNIFVTLSFGFDVAPKVLTFL
jgi:hypothetical protein